MYYVYGNKMSNITKSLTQNFKCIVYIKCNIKTIIAKFKEKYFQGYPFCDVIV